MIVVKINGGLGNQMFQYALCLSLMHLNKDVKVDVRRYKKVISEDRQLQLEKIFNIELRLAKENEIYQLADVNPRIISKIRRYVFGRQRPETFYQEKPSCIDNVPNIVALEHAYLEGFWHNEMYFQDIKSIIHDAFSFKIPLNKSSKKMKEIILNSNSVSIHVRRGDYLNHSDVCRVLDMDYYTRAMQIMQNRVSSPTFFVFSDDIEWCRNNMENGGVYFIDCNTEVNDCHMDMHLMSFCKHNIIANSTFSWWGAWLNRNPDKLVIQPEKWNFHEVDLDRAPQNWIKVKN